MNAVETRALGRRYGRTWALRGCTLPIPSGRVVALVGPNGAGKSTLLHLAVGLSAPTEGDIAVLGDLRPGSPGARDRVGFVAQDTPLYPNLTVADTLRLVGNLNRRWDAANARARLADLDIPLSRRVGRLSGGQVAQVALAVALARHPELLILDEPVARLDPLARHDFMAVLMAAVAEDGLSVLLSSHVVAELERVCDHLVVLTHGRVQVAGEVEDLLSTHHVFTGPTRDAAALRDRLAVVTELRGERQTSLLARANRPEVLPDGWQAMRTSLEELVLAYLRAPGVGALPGPRTELPRTVPA